MDPLPSKPVTNTPSTSPQRTPPGRMTVVQTVYFQADGQEPSSVDSRYNRDIVQDEHPYHRQSRVGEEWKLLDCGWIERACCLVIKNEPTKFHVQPTPEERAEATARVLEVAIRVDVSPKNRDMHTPRTQPVMAVWSLVHPGESLRVCPSSLKDLWVRCRSGECRFSVYLMPE